MNPVAEGHITVAHAKDDVQQILTILISVFRHSLVGLIGNMALLDVAQFITVTHLTVLAPLQYQTLGEVTDVRPDAEGRLPDDLLPLIEHPVVGPAPIEEFQHYRYRPVRTLDRLCFSQ